MAYSFNHIHCPRCTRLMYLSKLESSPKKSRYVFYCYADKHRRLKLVILQDRFTLSINEGKKKEEYSLAELKCIFCRRKLLFDGRDSYSRGSRWTGRCHNEKVELHFLGKPLTCEPTCDEVIQLLVRKSPY